MAGTGGARPGAGRPKGVSKATLEKIALAQREVAGAKASGKKLAKEVLDEFMQLFAGMAAYYQPTPATVPQQNANQDESKFKEYAVLACEQAAELAQYQSPKLRAILMPLPPPGDQPGRLIEATANAPGGQNVTPLSTDPEVLQQIYRRRIAQVG